MTGQRITWTGPSFSWIKDNVSILFYTPSEQHRIHFLGQSGLLVPTLATMGTTAGYGRMVPAGRAGSWREVRRTGLSRITSIRIRGQGIGELVRGRRQDVLVFGRTAPVAVNA